MAILIDNFSIGLKEWTKVSEIVDYSVDVVDLEYDVNVSGTYFLINETPVITMFSGIDSGYRATCSASMINGPQTITIHAENTFSGIEEIDYNFLFGYHVEFIDYIDWGPNKEIAIYTEATNMVTCPNKETYATYFRTRDLHGKDLGASIFPTGWSDLPASIIPQSKYFFYGNTYSITVSGVKDFSGNELEPFTFTFTIEDG